MCVTTFISYVYITCASGTCIYVSLDLTWNLMRKKYGEFFKTSTLIIDIIDDAQINEA